MNRLKIQRLESRRKTRDIYKVVGCLMPYRLCALTSAQLKLSSVRFMQQNAAMQPVMQSARLSISRSKIHILAWCCIICWFSFFKNAGLHSCGVNSHYDFATKSIPPQYAAAHTTANTREY